MFVLKGNSVVLGYDFVLWQTCGAIVITKREILSVQNKYSVPYSHCSCQFECKIISQFGQPPSSV